MSSPTRTGAHSRTARWWWKLLFTTLLLCAQLGHAAPPLTRVGLNAPDSTLGSTILPNRYLDPSSLLLINGSGDTLTPYIDFELDATLGRINWLRAQPGGTISASYFYLPVELPDTLSAHSLLNAVVVDSLLEDATPVTLLPARDPMSQLMRETSNLRRSGNVMRGVQIGSGRDVELQSGLSCSSKENLRKTYGCVPCSTTAACPYSRRERVDASTRLIRFTSILRQNRPTDGLATTN